MPLEPLTIFGRAIGPGRPAFLIAEAGVNHNGRFDLAQQLVGAAADAGADAVKFQTFNAERLAVRAAPALPHQGAGESQYELLTRLALSAEDHRRLIVECGRRRIGFLSSVFDEESADVLEALGVEAFKIPSGELINLPLLAHVAAKGKPMLVSTGMATLEEVRAAVETIRAAGHPPLVLLQCVSRYPTPPAEANLRAMRTLADAFGVPVGYSDHTPGIEVALAAAALGACVIEKHLTLDRALPGPDHHASLEPDEWAALARGVRTVESALGHGRKSPSAGEADTAAAARKSLVAAQPIPAGSVVTAEQIAAKRPGTGLSPALRGQVVGRRAKQAIPADTVLAWEMFVE